MSVAGELQPAPAPRPDGTLVLRGRAALVDLLEVLGGRLVKGPGGWAAWVSAVQGPGSSTSWGTSGGGTSPEGVVQKVLATRGRGDSVTISTLLTHEARTSELGRTVEREAIACVVLRMELAEFFASGGPLAAEREAGTPGRRASPVLSASELSRARAFAMLHLQNACFPPTCILDRGSVLDLIYAFHPAVLVEGQACECVWRVGDALGQFLHAARQLTPSQTIDVTGLLDEGELPRCRILKLARASVCDPDSVLKGAGRLLDALAAANPPLRPGTSAPPPAAMGLCTLPPAWDLRDFALEAHERAHLACDRPYIMPNPGLLRDMVVLLARRGHGWLDIETLAADPRYRLHALLGMQQTSLRGFKQHFRAALGLRDPHYPVRLPYGISRIARVADAEPGERARFILTVRNGGTPFEVTVDWDTLTSSVATARAVGKVLHRMPALVSAKVWRVFLDLALIDPRVQRTARALSGPGAVPLTTHLRAFLAKSESARGLGSPRSSRDPVGWPMRRDGVVVFPRPVLEAHLATAGVPYRRKELTLALESLGGGPRGIMHFRGVGKIL